MGNFRRAGLAVLVCALALVLGLAAREVAGNFGPVVRKPDSPGTGRPRSGGVLRLFGEAPASLDPLDVESVYESLPINQIFDGLLRLDSSVNVMPALAQTWTISSDGLRYTFDLRDGVVFHDGTPLTAGDVIFTFRRALAPRNGKRSVAASYMDAVEGATEFTTGRSRELPGIRALDDRTVEIRLKRPAPTFLDVLALDSLRIVPQSAVETMGEADFRRTPVGTGPFRFVSRDDRRLLLRANRAYFLKPPLLDEVQIDFPGDGETDRGAARFQRGEIDAFEAGPDALAELAGRQGVEVDRFQELNVYFLGFATAHPNFESPLVRRAVAHAIDRAAMVALSPETRTEAHGILPPGLHHYSPGTKTLAHDLHRARALLAQAGHANGSGLKPFKIYVAAGSLGEHRTFAQLGTDLRAAGFPCEVAIVTWQELAHRMNDQAASAFVIGWVADLADPDSFLHSLFVPQASANYFGFSDPETERLLGAAAMTTNPQERAQLYAEIERRILDQAPAVPLFHSIGLLARRAAVHGLEPGPLGLAAVDLERAWIEEER